MLKIGKEMELGMRLVDIYQILIDNKTKHCVTHIIRFTEYLKSGFIKDSIHSRWACSYCTKEPRNKLINLKKEANKNNFIFCYF